MSQEIIKIYELEFSFGTLHTPVSTYNFVQNEESQMWEYCGQDPVEKEQDRDVAEDDYFAIYMIIIDSRRHLIF